MNIAAGMSGLNAAVQMMRSLRDLAKAGELRSEEIPFRISEIYDYIVDSKDALVDAKDEISTLKAELQLLRQDRQVFLDGEVNWEKLPDGTVIGPLCPVCWGLDKKRLPMEKSETTTPNHVVYECQHHQRYIDRRVPKTVLAKYVG